MESDFDAVTFYDQVAEIYNRDSHPVIMDPHGAYQRGWAALVASLRPRRILEIGCGTGRRLRPLVAYYEVEGVTLPEIVGTDPAPRMLAAVHADVAQCVTLIETSDTSRFADNSFDLVYTSGVLCSVPNSVAAMIAREAVRITASHVLHTDTPKDGPHLNDLDLLGFHAGSGLELRYWNTLYPYPMPNEEEHQIILRKNGPAALPDTFPLRSLQPAYAESWRNLLERRLAT